MSERLRGESPIDVALNRYAAAKLTWDLHMQRAEILALKAEEEAGGPGWVYSGDQFYSTMDYALLPTAKEGSIFVSRALKALNDAVLATNPWYMRFPGLYDKFRLIQVPEDDGEHVYFYDRAYKDPDGNHAPQLRRIEKATWDRVIDVLYGVRAIAQHSEPGSPVVLHRHADFIKDRLLEKPSIFK